MWGNGYVGLQMTVSQHGCTGADRSRGVVAMVVGRVMLGVATSGGVTLCMWRWECGILGRVSRSGAAGQGAG